MTNATSAYFALLARNADGKPAAVITDGTDEAAVFRRRHERIGHTVERLPVEEARRVVREEGLPAKRDYVP